MLSQSLSHFASSTYWSCVSLYWFEPKMGCFFKKGKKKSATFSFPILKVKVKGNQIFKIGHFGVRKNIIPRFLSCTLTISYYNIGSLVQYYSGHLTNDLYDQVTWKTGTSAAFSLSLLYIDHKNRTRQKWNKRPLGLLWSLTLQAASWAKKKNNLTFLQNWMAPT